LGKCKELQLCEKNLSFPPVLSHSFFTFAPQAIQFPAMNIILIGYGKMGKAIEQTALEKGHVIVHKISSKNQSDFTPDRLRQADVAIEFTRPDAALNNLKLCLDAGIPVVSGTTGWNEKLNELKDYCKAKNGTLLWSSNFGIGVNIFFELNERLARLLSGKNYQISIEETHHIHKLDKPSGTAITLAGKFIETGLYSDWSLAKEKNKLPVYCERKDEITGIHTVHCISEDDKITLTHEAFNRTAFAKGAVMAAEWLQGKKGVFSMKDVISNI
jgi:4-hydroxy-tetrahydrodipicolinate reductase